MAEIAPGSGARWFSDYLPGELVLGDPGARDAAIHAIQACIPHAAVLPVGVERTFSRPALGAGPSFTLAQERERVGDTLVYDLDIVEGDGRLIERWEGLRLRIVDRDAYRGPWSAPLLRPYVERRVEELCEGAKVRVFVERDASNGDRRSRSSRSVRMALGEASVLQRRPDGKPELDTRQCVSVAHTGLLTLAVVGATGLACDLEPVVERPSSAWRNLLGHQGVRLAQQIQADNSDSFDTAATRVWTARECLQKAGAPPDAPLTLRSCNRDGWTLLASGRRLTAAVALELRGDGRPVVLAVQVDSAHVATEREGMHPCAPMSIATEWASKKRI